MQRFSLAALAGWLLGVGFCATLFSLGLPQIRVLLAERGPSRLTCEEFFRRGGRIRWVRLEHCRVDLERALELQDRKGVGGQSRARFVPVRPADGDSTAFPLFVRLESGSGASISSVNDELEGMIDVRAGEDVPADLSAQGARILYVGRPSILELVLALGPSLAFCVLATRALRRHRRQSRVLDELRARARSGKAEAWAGTHTSAGHARGLASGEEHPGVRVEALDLDSLLRLRHRIAWALGTPAAFVSSFVVVILVLLVDPWVGHSPRAIAVVCFASIGGLFAGFWLWRHAQGAWRRRPPVARAYVVAASTTLSYLILLVSCLLLAPLPGDPIGLATPIAILLVLVQLPLCWSLLSAIRGFERSASFASACVVDGVLQEMIGKGGVRSMLGRRKSLILLLRLLALPFAVAAALGVLANLVLPGCAMLLAIAAAAGASFLWRRARRHGTPRAEEIRALDRRPPVLLLRSFVDDHLQVDKNDLSELDVSRLVAERLNFLGPVIAPPSTTESLPPVGPYRVDLQGRDWKEVVALLVSDAVAVVLIFGRSAGLAWELDHILKGSAIAKTAILIPPVDPEELARRWSTLADRQWQPAIATLSSVDPTRLLIAQLTNSGALRTITAGARNKRSYSAALAALVAGTRSGPARWPPP
jgi:hypothetical protein